MFPPATPTPTFPYRILRKIGEGGMGEVYQAEDLELTRQVAIKIIKPAFIAALPAPEAQMILQRFVQEARAAAAISHVGVTAVHRIGTEAGWPFIAMEWIEGKSLETILKERHRLPVQQVARLGVQVLASLTAAHQAGVIHRDIKPANLMVNLQGKVKITDFGVARMQNSQLAHTQIGLVMGTPQYAAPEQLAGSPVDARADLYALACVLYEALTGRTPFVGANLPALLEQVRSAPIPALSALIPGLPDDLDSALRRALGKRPEERYPDAASMAAALTPFLNQAPANAQVAAVAAVAPVGAVAPAAAAAAAQGPFAPGTLMGVASAGAPAPVAPASQAQQAAASVVAPPNSAVNPVLAAAAAPVPSPQALMGQALYASGAQAMTPGSSSFYGAAASSAPPPPVPYAPGYAPSPSQPAMPAQFGGAQVAQADGSIPFATSPTVQHLATTVVEGNTPWQLVASAVRQWSPVPLGRQARGRLLERLLERPLHAPAFSGAMETAGACVLLHDGIIYGAFDPASGRTGDEVLEKLPDELEATLYPVPPAAEPRLTVILASLIGTPKVRHKDLDASFANLPQLSEKLAREGFDGVIRFVQAGNLGFALFSRGVRVLDLFSRGWPQAPQPGTRWEEWIASSGAQASVESLSIDYPSITFRQQLEGVSLDVLRAAPSDTGSIRHDTLATASALQLVPSKQSRLDLRRGESTMQSLLEGDPTRDAVRWLLVELEPQFTQYGRANAWKAMISTLGQVRTVQLHRSAPKAPPGSGAFDAITLGEHGELLQVVDRVGHASARTVDRFIDKLLEAKQAHPELGGAMLSAPAFDEDTLDHYLKRLEGSRKGSLRGSLDALSHREGYLRASKGGLHVLLVEEGEGRRRPLVPEAR